MCVSSPHANVGVAYKKLFINNLFNCLHVCLFNSNLFISCHNYNNFCITASEDDTHKDVTKYQEKNKKQQPTFRDLKIEESYVHLTEISKESYVHFWRN